MKNTNYHLHLKGYVGGCDFDRNYVDYILARNEGKPVNVLIDSLGGALATAFLSNNNYKCGFDLKTTEFGIILEIENLFLFFLLRKCLLYSEN